MALQFQIGAFGAVVIALASFAAHEEAVEMKARAAICSGFPTAEHAACDMAFDADGASGARKLAMAMREEDAQ